MLKWNGNVNSVHGMDNRVNGLGSGLCDGEKRQGEEMEGKGKNEGN